jgi:APA family basic amino acid/polyamine antiporter
VSDRRNGGKRLSKTLGLRDVYSISTGAMFSSGFFLLPGLAVAAAGPAAVVAYLIAGLLILPAALSMLELATALPRAGGAYYFIDRSLGPAAGTIAGIGTWLSLVLKSAFALVGMGAYLAITPGIGQFIEHGSTATIWFMKVLAVVLTVVFVVVNSLGAKETTRLQKLLVAGLLSVLLLFLAEGLWHVFARLPAGALTANYQPFISGDNGWHGLFGTVGLVFVSYAGLTKVASVSEEVAQPERNLPLGVFLSLATATLVYVVGMFIMVAALGPERLSGSYAPVGMAAAAISGWLPGPIMLILVIVAAVAAFVSTGNAGILAASRYPLAMARDRLLPGRLEHVGKSGAPILGIVLTGAVMIVFILALPLADVAKLGSTFNLLVFGLVNLAVLVMRESRIEGYDPSFRVPLYPWLPVGGMLVSGWLIVEMGLLSIGFSLGVIVLSLLWYLWYVRPKVERAGALHHVFARMGRYRHPGLQSEFREIVKEKGLREHDPYDTLVERAHFIEIEANASFDDVLAQAAQVLGDDLPLSAEQLIERMLQTGRYGGTPISHGAALLHLRMTIDRPRLVIARAADGICVELGSDVEAEGAERSCDVYAVFFLISPRQESGQHFRILAQLAKRAEDRSFIDPWRRVRDPRKLKELLLEDASFLTLLAGEDPSTQPLIGKAAAELDLPSGAFIATIRRHGELFELRGETRIERGDHVVFIGEPAAIGRLSQTYIESDAEG